MTLDRESTHPAAGDGPPAGGRLLRPSGQADPQTILLGEPRGTRNYLRVLGALVNRHNYKHAAKHKGVGRKTMLERQRFLARFFRDMRQNTRFVDLDPRDLASRHVIAAIALWRERGLATGTMHVYLSYLRVFASWIGKPGMVRDVAYYVGTASPHARRKLAATYDHSWSARAVDFEKALPGITRLDPWVGLQAELCYRFAMRPQEARFFRPHGAVIPRAAADPRDAEAFPDQDTFVRIRCGTKGGRPRDVPLVDDAQRELLERAMSIVAPGQFVGRPGRTATQNRRRFYYIMERCGVTKAKLGVVPHGLRHERANDTYEELAGGPSVVRGGRVVPDHDVSARTAVSAMLGHNRTQVAACYLGRQVRAATVRTQRASK